MGFLGYQKDEIRTHNDKRCCGLWFMIIGVVIIVAAIFGGEQKIHSIIFTVGFLGGFYISAINKRVTAKLSWGEMTKFQNKMANFSIGMLFPMMFLLAGPFFPSQNWRMIWLGAFLAVGLHFFPFYFVRGSSMFGISVLCSANAIIGMAFPAIPFMVFALIDGIIKIAFGVYLLFLAKPTTSRMQ